MPKANSDIDIFQYIEVRGKDDCWPWNGPPSSVNKDRPYFWHEGRKWVAARLIYEMVNGSLATGQVVRHTCDNSMCCNPHHLIPGTQSDNEQDKYLNDRAGIPVAAVREIKRLLQATEHIPQHLIAKYVSERFNYNVSRSAVRNIKLGLRRGNSDQARTAAEVAGFEVQLDDSDTDSDDEDLTS